MKQDSNSGEIIHSSQRVRVSLELVCFFAMAFLCHVQPPPCAPSLFKKPTLLSLLSRTPSTKVGEGPVIQVDLYIPKEEVTETGSWGKGYTCYSIYCQHDLPGPNLSISITVILLKH